MQENRTSTYNNVSNLKSFQDVRTLTKKINHGQILTTYTGAKASLLWIVEFEGKR